MESSVKYTNHFVLLSCISLYLCISLYFIHGYVSLKLFNQNKWWQVVLTLWLLYKDMSPVTKTTINKGWRMKGKLTAQLIQFSHTCKDTYKMFVVRGRGACDQSTPLIAFDMSATRNVQVRKRSFPIALKIFAYFWFKGVRKPCWCL